MAVLYGPGNVWLKDASAGSVSKNSGIKRQTLSDISVSGVTRVFALIADAAGNYKL